MTRPLRVGLTGGVASGKTAVADAFAALGVPVLDADAIAREVVAPGRPALAGIVDAFGPGVLDALGALDRRALRERVFRDPDARRRLESLLHPAIWQELDRQSAAAGGAYLVLVIPLLVETGATGAVDRVLVVDCPVETQLARLAERDGETEAAGRAMLAAQATRAARLAAAHDVLVNDGTLEELRHKVAALDRSYRALAASKR